MILTNWSLVLLDLSFRGSAQFSNLAFGILSQSELPNLRFQTFPCFHRTRDLRVFIRAGCTGVSEGTKVALMAIRPPISSAMREEAAFQR